MRRITRIGIIQNAPLPADLSNNLRHIVQGYRDCIDHGAQLVVAPAHALSGSDLHDLAERRSFLCQQKAAMEALSMELSDAPLVLGGYATLCDGLDGDWGEDVAEDSAHSRPCSMVPFLLEKDCVTELCEGEVSEVSGTRLYIDTEMEEVKPETLDFDILIHLGTGPWYAGAAKQDTEARLWEADVNGVPVVSLHHVGTVEEKIYGGGSGVFIPGHRTLVQMPYFEEGSRVADLHSKGIKDAPIPSDEELLVLALQRGIRDTVRNNGYTGACIPMDHPNAPLLATLAMQALGSAHVTGISFEGNDHAAKVLGIGYKSLSADEALGSVRNQLENPEKDTLLVERMKGLLCSTYAEVKGLMLLCPLDRPHYMMGDFVLYGQTCGMLAPLANLYEIDLYLLSQFFSYRFPDLFGALAEPSAPQRDSIIHELADLNTSPSDLLKHPDYYKENDVRSIQRRIIASALKRSQFPLILHVDAQEEQLTFPICHRLND